MNRLVTLILCCIAYGVTGSEFRITSDEQAAPGEVPYQVSLQMYGQHICGGSLIGPRHVLTAAHCIRRIIHNPALKADLKISVGSNIVSGGTIHDVDRVAHPKAYNPNTFVADIAVVRLTNPVAESSNTRIISLPEPSLQLNAGQNFFVSGFGTSRMQGPTSSYLKKLEMTAVSHVACQQRWPQIAINSGLFCVTTPSGDGVCEGDSGGPVTIDKQTVVGVAVAVNPQGCGTHVPDLITRVSTYIKFIRNELARTY